MGEVVQIRDWAPSRAFRKISEGLEEALSVARDEGNGGSKDKQNRAFWIGQPDTSPCEMPTDSGDCA